MTDLLGPGDAGAPRALSAPPAGDVLDPVAGDTFFQDCVAGTPGTGTPYAARWVNRLLDQIRNLIRAGGAALSNIDGSMLTKAIQYMIQQDRPNWAGAFGGSANALTFTLTPTPIATPPGFAVKGIVQFANTDQVTLQGSPLLDPSGYALPPGYLQPNVRITAESDGANWRLTAPAPGPQCIFTVSSAANQPMANGAPTNLIPGADADFKFVGTLRSGVFTFARRGLYHITFDATLQETVVGANQLSGGLRLIHNGGPGAGGAPTDTSYAHQSGTYTQQPSLSTMLMVAGGDTISLQGTVSADSNFTSGACTALGMTIWMSS